MHESSCGMLLEVFVSWCFMTLYVRSSSRSHCMTILPHWRWRWFKSRRPWTMILSEGFVSPCSPQHCVGSFAGIMKLRSIYIYIAISISIVVSCCIYNNTIYHIISYHIILLITLCYVSNPSVVHLQPSRLSPPLTSPAWWLTWCQRVLAG